MNRPLLVAAVRVWLVEVLVSGFNYGVLMNLVYEPALGELRAHQIGMSTRIIYLFVFAWLLLRYARSYSVRDLIHVGILWLALALFVLAYVAVILEERIHIAKSKPVMLAAALIWEIGRAHV